MHAGQTHPWLHKHFITSARHGWICWIATYPKRSRICWIATYPKRSRICWIATYPNISTKRTMKDKGYIVVVDSLDRQSLPLYFSDQSKYHSHPSLEPVTQLTRVVSLPRDTTTPRDERYSTGSDIALALPTGRTATQRSPVLWLTLEAGS